MKHILLMDTDTAYVENAAVWAGLHIRDKVRLTILTDPDAAYEALEKVLPADCILISSTMLLAMEPDRLLTPLATVFLLEDGEPILDVLQSGTRIHHLSKYQSIRTLYETVLESALPLKLGAVSQRAQMTVTFSCLHAGLCSDTAPVASAMALLLASWHYRVFFFDLEFGMVNNDFAIPSGEHDICDLLLHTKNNNHRNAERIQDCMGQDPVTGVYAFRDGAGAFEREDVDAQSLQWIINSLIASNLFDFVVINAGAHVTSALSEVILQMDCPFVVFNGISEHRTHRCQRLFKALQLKKSEQLKKPQLLSVGHLDTNKVLSCDVMEYAVGLHPIASLQETNWSQNFVFLEQIAGAILPHIKGGD